MEPVGSVKTKFDTASFSTEPSNTMNEAPVALVGHSPGSLPHLIRKKLSDILLEISQTVLPYWWRLIGDHPESLCNLLLLSESDMNTILRGAEVFSAKGYMIKMQKFELLSELMKSENFDWSVYRAPNRKKQVPYLRIGSNKLANHSIDTIIERPKDQYCKKELIVPPLIRKHVKPRLSKKIKNAIQELLKMAKQDVTTGDSEKQSTPALGNTNATHYLQLPPAERLAKLVGTLLEDQAAEFGQHDFSLSVRQKRRIKKSTGHILNQTAQDLLKDYIKKLSKEVEASYTGAGDPPMSCDVERPDGVVSNLKELQHQVLKKLRDRYRRVSSYQRKSVCLLRESRRQKNTQINRILARFMRLRKQKSGNKRYRAATDRQQEIREAKRIKREAFVEG